MKNKKSEEQSFNITLSEFLDSHLRTDFCAPIARKIAEIVEVISKDSLKCHVQWTDFEGNRLDTPLLWRYKYWVESADKYNSLKLRAERERKERFIFNRNLEILTEACEATMLLDKTRARDISLRILLEKRYKMLKVLEVELITSIDDV